MSGNGDGPDDMGMLFDFDPFYWREHEILGRVGLQA